MHVEIRSQAEDAIRDAADLLAGWIRDEGARGLMVAGGNTPLPLYEEVARRGVDATDLRINVLDEYVGVPNDHPRTCTNLLRAAVADAWGISSGNFYGLSSDDGDAEPAVVAHEARIDATGGLDAIVLGLGKNGHLGFNEPGSAPDSGARIVDLDEISIEANRVWFGRDYAPRRGATVGLRTILAARRVILLAFGGAKAAAVHAMVNGPRTSACPASFLRNHRDVHIFLDEHVTLSLDEATRFRSGDSAATGGGPSKP